MGGFPLPLCQPALVFRLGANALVLDSLLSNEQKTLCYSPTSTLQIRVGADGRLNDPIDLKAPTANGTAVAIQNADWNFIISISSQQGPRSVRPPPPLPNFGTLL